MEIEIGGFRAEKYVLSDLKLDLTPIWPPGDDRG